ncbi:MAG: hypothetical protein AABY73_00225 [Pseudomonadota bacterium]
MVQRLGIIAIWLGIIASVVGLIVGFAKLPNGDEAAAGPWLSLVPVGFALLLLGTAITQLGKK